MALFLLSVSCKEVEESELWTEVNVKATNIVTEDPYGGLKFSVVQQTPGVFESHYKNVYEGYLDVNGEATFDFKMKNNKSYSLGIELPESICYFNDLYFSLKHDLTTQDVMVDFAPCAYINLDIENINCEGTQDSMKFRSKYNYTDWQSWSSFRTGCYQYYIPDQYGEIPSGWRIYEWEVNRSGVVTNFIDSIYLDAGEYATFVMEY